MNKEDFKFIYQDDGYYLILYKNNPLTYVDYDNFDFADLDKLSESEINDKITELFIEDLEGIEKYEG